MLVKTCNQKEHKFNILGFVDDGLVPGTKVHDYLVLGDTEYLHNLTEKPALVLAVGAPHLKRELTEKLKEFEFVSLIHPSVKISEFSKAKIGAGVVICEGNILTCDYILEDYVTLNLNCTVGHDSKLSKYASCMPGVNISGEVILEQGVYVGTGATIINQVRIGENAIIGAGATVAKDIPPNCTAVGMPAKPIKFHS
jgi:sugar O-acyltransferase (sialic acid O-acetyltransferase NeuD family)